MGGSRAGRGAPRPRRRGAAAPGSRLAAAAAWALGALNGAGGQHATLFTADVAGGDRQSPWSGVIAYTSFEEAPQDDTPPALGSGLAYYDDFDQCAIGTPALVTSNVVWDHELGPRVPY